MLIGALLSPAPNAKGASDRMVLPVRYFPSPAKTEGVSDCLISRQSSLDCIVVRQSSLGEHGEQRLGRGHRPPGGIGPDAWGPGERERRER